MPQNTYILSEFLQSSGVEVQCRNRAEEALELYRTNNNIDLVITDLRMPGMSGQRLIAEIRLHEHDSGKARVPILVLTGEASTAEKTACLSHHGADAYLVKPVRLQELSDGIAKALDHKEDSNRGKSVMVVEDDPVSRKILANLLKHGGNAVAEFGTVSEVRNS